MTTVELTAIARSLVAPAGANGVCVVVDHRSGQKLPTGQPSGIGGQTRYRIAFTDGLAKFPSGPPFEKQRDAYRLADLLS